MRNLKTGLDTIQPNGTYCIGKLCTTEGLICPTSEDKGPMMFTLESEFVYFFNFNI